MYIFKNAYTSIVRNKGRNLLIGIIILVIACTTAVTLAINNSSTKLIKSYQSKYEIEATIGIDRDNMMKDFDSEDRENSKDNLQNLFSEASNVSIKDIDTYGDSQYVKEYYYTVTLGVNSTSMESASSKRGGNVFGGMMPGGMSFSNETSGDFTLKGYSSIDSMSEFIEGNYKITEGEVSEDFESSDCLINSELATLNDLEVGDTITIVDPDDESKTYEMKITGIYEEKSECSNGMSMFSDSVNTIITNSNFVLKVQEENENLEISVSPTFILESKSVVDDFESELREKGLNENLSVETNIDQVESSTSAISNVKTFSNTFLIITLIIGAIVLFVINMINIRERKYEIGVLRTIGMKKRNVSMQFILEIFIVTFVFLLLGTAIGATLSVPVSNNLLRNEITSSQNETEDIRENFGKPGSMGGGPSMDFSSGSFINVNSIQEFDSINATVDIKVLLEILWIGLILTLVSATSAIAAVQNFSPLTILKERS